MLALGYLAANPKLFGQVAAEFYKARKRKPI
jgi:hypothetical protein